MSSLLGVNRAGVKLRVGEEFRQPKRHSLPKAFHRLACGGGRFQEEVGQIAIRLNQKARSYLRRRGIPLDLQVATAWVWARPAAL